MIYSEAPNYPKPGLIKRWEKSVFLGGSITSAVDWQKHAAKTLLPYFHVFNPRRNNYQKDESQDRIQIAWERNYLNSCDILLFYFSNETVAPITLFEYGVALEQSKHAEFKRIYPCIHPNYSRKNDLLIQTELINSQWSKNITFDLVEALSVIIEENV